MNAQKKLEPVESDVIGENLSEREWQVMLLLVKGKRVSQIAKDLELSIKTISTYFARIKLKTGLRTVAALSIQAAKQGLV